MNGAQLHLALNHLPVILSLAGFAVLAWGWGCGNAEIRKVGLTLLVATALCAIATFLTGDPAEDVLRNFPEFSKDLVHEHEEAGETALIISIVTGVAASSALYFTSRKSSLTRYALGSSIALALLSSLAFLNTAHLGGLIHHEEIRPGVTAPEKPSQPSEAPGH